MPDDDKTNPEDTVGGQAPSWLADLFQKGFAGLPAGILDMMVTSVISTAVRRLPREKKVQAILYLAELLWPGSTETPP